VEVFFTTARTTSAAATIKMIAPSTHRVRPDVPSAWQLHPGLQAAASVGGCSVGALDPVASFF